MKKPDEQVAENIVAEFKKQKLLPDAALEKIKPKLIAGTMSAPDWKLAFEVPKAQKEAAK